MGIQERRSRQKRTLRQEILAAARDLFAREGYENVTMRGIAERIEYSPTTIYLHFKDKAELLQQICEDTFDQLIEQLEQARHYDADPVASLKAGLRAYVRFGLENPQHYRVVFMTPSKTASGARAFGILVQAVESCVRAGRFGNPDVALASQLLWAGVHGLTSLLIARPDFAWIGRDRLIEAMIDNLLRGLERQQL